MIVELSRGSNCTVRAHPSGALEHLQILDPRGWMPLGLLLKAEILCSIGVWWAPNLEFDAVKLKFRYAQAHVFENCTSNAMLRPDLGPESVNA